MDPRDIASLHFIGIGGAGMSGIASVAHDQGIAVTGSDLKESRYTKQLASQGIAVSIGQDAANIPADDPVVVVSTAILENNPELIEAQRRGLPIVHRAQMLAHLGRDLKTLAVATLAKIFSLCYNTNNFKFTEACIMLCIKSLKSTPPREIVVIHI